MCLLKDRKEGNIETFLDFSSAINEIGLRIRVAEYSIKCKLEISV